MRAGSLALLVGCATVATEGDRGSTTSTLASDATSATASTSASPRGPHTTAAMAPGCQAPLRVAQEVNRLLVAAAAHGTRSASCVDGRGLHVTIESVHVCPAPDRGKRKIMRAAYRVRVQDEGDTRGCKTAGDCAWREPRTSEHEIEIGLVETTGGLAIGLPTSVPGIDAMTPLDREHDGDCYGASDPFVPAVLKR